MIRLCFDDDDGQRRFQYMYGALLVASPLQRDIEVLSLQARLFAKLEAISVPDERAEPVGLKRPRILPEPCAVSLEEGEVKILVAYLQLVPWQTSAAVAADDALGFLLRAPRTQA